MSESKLVSNLFTERLRPQTLEHTVIVPRIYQELSKGLIDNILLYGSAGAGKTTLSRIMAKGHDTLYINASLERGIDIIRDQVVSFASSSSLMDGAEQLKVVLLEECDNLTNDAWASLRAIIERYNKTVRFIANCNYIEKIPDPIKSRFNCIPIDPINPEEEQILFNGYINRIKKILTSLKIEFSDQDVYSFVKNDFPDMRSLIKKIQQIVTKGLKKLDIKSLDMSFDSSNLFNILIGEPDPWKNYKQICEEWTNRPEDGILLIGQKFPEFLRNNMPKKINKLPEIIIATAEHNEQLSRVTDKLITLLSLVYKIQIILNM